jgi:hypothetical protein
MKLLVLAFGEEFFDASEQTIRTTSKYVALDNF